MEIRQTTMGNGNENWKGEIICEKKERWVWKWKGIKIVKMKMGSV